LTLWLIDSSLINTEKRSLKLGDITPYPALLEAVKKAWSDVGRGKYGPRDLALVTTLVFTGYRIGEVVQLKKTRCRLQEESSSR